MRISERLLTVLAICLIAAAVPAFARGKGERELKQSQELIDRKQYSEAITLLAETLKAFPELREQINKQVTGIVEQASRLVREKEYAAAMNLLVQIIEGFPDLRKQADKVVAEIMAARERFNEKYKELLAVIKEVPPDVELGLAIIKELTDLDPNPDEAIRESIEIAHQKLVSAEKYLQFTERMDAASALIKDGKLREAIAAYREKVFPIARADFDTAPHPALLREQALSVVRSLEEASRLAETQLDAPATLPAALDALLAAPVTDAGRGVFAGKLQLLVQARQLEARIRELGVDLRGVNAAIDTANGADGFKDLWLGFVEQAALGRKELPPEGIAFAARQPWVAKVRELSDKAVPAADDSFQKTEKAFSGKIDLPVFRTLAADARNRALVAQSVLDLEAAAWVPAEGLTLSAADTARAVKVKELAAQMQRHAADADAMVAFAEAEAAANGMLEALDSRFNQARSTPADDPASLSQTRLELGSIVQAAKSGSDEWRLRAASAAPVAAMATRAPQIRDRFDRIEAEAFAADTSLAARLAGLEAVSFEPGYARAAKGLADGLAFAAGTMAGEESSGKRPEKALEEYKPALDTAEKLVTAVDKWQKKWTSEPDRVRTSVEIEGLLAVYRGLPDKIRELQTNIQKEKVSAQAAVDMATQLRGQGDSAFRDGQAKKDQQKFQEALGLYTTARNSYAQSLEKQENAAARKRLTEDLPGLIDQMNKEVNAVKASRATDLFNQGVKEFSERNYEKAVKTFEAARDEWNAAGTGVDFTANDIFLDRAKSALLVTGRQEIKRTDPIYEDIRGFMTQAELSYNRADSLQKQGIRSDEYRAAITAARSSVQAIRAVLPEYREARELELKIDRLEDGKDVFEKKLRQKVDDAIRIAKDPRAQKELWQDALYSLAAYRQFAPSAWRREIDRGISDIELNLYGPPKAGYDVNASMKHYQTAIAEYRKGPNQKIYWESALWYLQLSLGAWELNQDALRLRGEINGKRKTLIDVLSPSELASYRTAVNDTVNRNFLRAEQTVLKLLQGDPPQNPGKPRNPLLLDLLEQIRRAR